MMLKWRIYIGNVVYRYTITNVRNSPMITSSFIKNNKYTSILNTNTSSQNPQTPVEDGNQDPISYSTLHIIMDHLLFCISGILISSIITVSLIYCYYQWNLGRIQYIRLKVYYIYKGFVDGCSRCCRKSICGCNYMKQLCCGKTDGYSPLSMNKTSPDIESSNDKEILLV